MVKRYEPAPHGGMMERSDGKYYHRNDVIDLLISAQSADVFIKSMSKSLGITNHLSNELYEKLMEWKDESV